MLCLSNSMNWLINETVLTGNSPGSRRGGNQTIYNKWYTSIKQITFQNNRNNGTMCKIFLKSLI